tara:strand:- start:1637 stop:2443 length:807 start_codon:yes stop_codon:yes gene_type:complete
LANAPGQPAPAPAVPAGRQKGGYNWVPGEEIMALFAVLYASEKVDNSEVPERIVNAGVFYRKMILVLPQWGLWWPSPSGAIKTPEDSLRFRTDEAIFNKGNANKPLLDKMVRLFAKQWKYPKDVQDDQAEFLTFQSGCTEEQWWEKCEAKAVEMWQAEVVKGQAAGDSSWKNYRQSTFPWVFRLASPCSPFLKDVEKFKTIVTKGRPGLSTTHAAFVAAHKWFSERVTRASLFGQWIINPNHRTAAASRGVPKARQKVQFTSEYFGRL